MKKILTLILVSAVGFTSCHNAGKNSNLSVNTIDLGGDTVNVKEVFNKFAAKTIETGKVPKYEVVKGGTRALGSGVEQLKTDNTSSCPVLTKLIELNSGAEYNVYKFDQSMQAGLQAMGFNGSLSKHELLFVEDYVRYKICNQDHKRYGIGLRCFIHVTSVKGKLSYSSLPAIAANVELNNAKATFNIKSLGFAFDGSLLAGTPVTGDYNVDDFGKLAVIFTNVAKLLTDDSKISFSPVELPVPQQ